MKTFLFSFFLLLFCCLTNAQVGIGTPAPAATLDITASNPSGTATAVDGILIPRVTRQRAQSMTGTPTSTIIYVTEVVTGTATGTTSNVNTIGFYFFNGSTWETLSTSGATNWTTTGNSGLTGTTNFLGTTDNVDVAFRRSGAAAGKIAASSTSFGVGALGTSTANNNTAIGAGALSGNTSGTSNVALGLNAGSNITSGSNNIMIGAITAAPSATGTFQLNIGNTIYGSLSPINRNIGIGTTTPRGALEIFSSNNGLVIPNISLTNGIADALPLTLPTTSEIIYNTNTVGGATPGFYFWDGSSWVRFATGALSGWSTTGNAGLTAGTNFLGTTDAVDVSFKRNNTAAGFIGANSTAFGTSSLAANAGTNNTAFGTNALAANNSPGDNTAFGFNALAANTQNSGAGNLNTAVGSGALDSLNGGARNTAVGANALTGVNGNASLDNVAVGHNALQGAGTITQSVAIGAGALLNSGSATTRSTAIGFNAGNNISLSIDSVFLGTNALGTGATATNQIVIGSGASSNADNTVTLGNSSIGFLRCAATTITALSDRRDKADIVTLAEGIEFIKKLKPVTYTWNTRDKSKVGSKAAGFIAQDLLDLQQKSAIGENLDLVTYNNPDRLEARYGNLLPVIVKGIQEQQSEIEALKKANEELMKINAAILERLEKLEKK